MRAILGKRRHGRKPLPAAAPNGSTASVEAAKLAAANTRCGGAMKERLFGLGRALILGALGAALCGCVGHENRVMSGDADGLTIFYAGDVAATLPLARQYCIQYERVADLISYNSEHAIYACVDRHRPSHQEHGALNPKLTLITDLLSLRAV
jgi:hypothetical protein